MTIFYWLALNITRLLRMLVYRVRYIGVGNIPREGGYVVACNHRSFIDPVILAHGIPRQVFYMGKAELFDKPLSAWLMNGVGVFPVTRGTGDTSALDYAVDLLKEGGLLGIFPEGTRSPTERPGRFKSGMAHIARTSGVGVLPCAVCFPGKLSLWKRVEIKFGTPISYEELFGEEESAAALKRATKLVSGRITELLDLGEGTE